MSIVLVDLCGVYLRDITLRLVMFAARVSKGGLFLKIFTVRTVIYLKFLVVVLEAGGSVVLSKDR